MNLPYIIVPLSSAYDRAAFDCGEPSLNEFLKRYARQRRQARNVSALASFPSL